MRAFLQCQLIMTAVVLLLGISNGCHLKISKNLMVFSLDIGFF